MVENDRLFELYEELEGVRGEIAHYKSELEGAEEREEEIEREIRGLEGMSEGEKIDL